MRENEELEREMKVADFPSCAALPFSLQTERSSLSTPSC